MNYEDLNCTMNGSVLVIELNRPAKRNAMRLSLREELIDALTTAEQNDDVTGIVVTGAGDKAFSAGADLSELQQRTVESEMSRTAELRRRLPALTETLAKPVVAAVNGACLGAGLEFALACTVRVASTTAKFGMPEVLLGVIPGSGGTQRLTRTVGLGWSLHLTLEGKPIDAQQAYRIGLVTGLSAPEDLLSDAVALAETMGGQPRMAFLTARDAINRSLDLDLNAGIDLERKLFALCLSTGEPQQLAAAMLERLSTKTTGNGNTADPVLQSG
ncbi:enoyl-CoA hydratase/isomerase family protein [Rhodococcus opacus]|uniref:enoyl-CoA hydratase/isomerase family protein n=1 Tax=Rhodococcus opacus TaxID=37919 RepID=UPI00294A4CBE|nr:enoyl-CoA hydratase/isomerase family protein [Rhodococcus opacus]MDV6247043.1 enoyl-CoA hydratase/isomerase family protein [Rhodococcus opacus]